MADTNGTRTIWIAVVLSIISGAGVSVLDAVWWSASWRATITLRLTTLEARNDAQDKLLERIEIGGTRAIPLLELKIQQLQNDISSGRQQMERLNQLLSEHERSTRRMFEQLPDRSK